MRPLYRLSVLLMLAGAAVGLLLLTWNLGRTYVGLVVQQDVPASAAVSETVLVLPELQFWTCQTGVFTYRENAEQQVEILRSQGWEAQIFAENPYAVGVGVRSSKEETEDIRQGLSASGITTVPKQVLIAESSFRVVGNGVEQTVQILQEVNKYIASGLDPDVLEQVIIALPPEESIPRELQGLRQNLLDQQAGVNSASLRYAGLFVYREYGAAIGALMEQPSFIQTSYWLE